jgi:hypothetical protein
VARKLKKQIERDRARLGIQQAVVYSSQLQQQERQVILPPQLNFFGQPLISQEPTVQEPLIVPEQIVPMENTNIPTPLEIPKDFTTPGLASREGSVALNFSPKSSEVIEKNLLANNSNLLSAEIRD